MLPGLTKSTRNCYLIPVMRVLVAVISYNEEANIGRALCDLIEFRENEAPFPFDIVVIDNGSRDSTLAVAKQHDIPVVSHCVHSGGSGGTVATYFRYANHHNYDVLVQFDGDAQHLASQLPNIVEPVLKDGYDYVIGSRYLKKEGFQSTATRRLGIKMFNTLTTFLTGVRVTDMTSGARAYSQKVISLFAREYQHEIYDPMQLFILSHYHGAKVLEVPVVMREREYGESEFSLFNAVSFMLRGVANLVACFLQRDRVRALGR